MSDQDHAKTITDALDLVAAEKPWTTQDARASLDTLLDEKQRLRERVSELEAMVSALGRRLQAGGVAR